MAKANNIEFRVGVIVILGLIILIVSLYWLQGYELRRNAKFVTVRFDDVGTLAVGDRVTVSGVHKGKVNGLRLTEGGVLVELQFYRDVIIKRDATFTIRNFGLMGERFIAVWPGSDSVEFDLASEAIGAYDPGIPEVMGLLGDMIVELRQVVSSLKRSVASDSSLQRLDRTLSNFESVSASLAGYLERNESRLDEVATNFLTASRNVKQLLQRNTAAIDSSADRLDRASGRLEQFTCQLDTLATSARHFADALENEEGTLQMLVEDRRLYDDLRRTADNLDDLISDIRANPGKYVNLKVELF